MNMNSRWQPAARGSRSGETVRDEARSGDYFRRVKERLVAKALRDLRFSVGHTTERRVQSSHRDRVWRIGHVDLANTGMAGRHGRRRVTVREGAVQSDIVAEEEEKRDRQPFSHTFMRLPDKPAARKEAREAGGGGYRPSAYRLLNHRPPGAMTR